ncbi:MAG: acylphosphatase [Rubrivivax sp.]|nr:acylphosphatase [Rubrivivax sp.]
MNENDAGSPVPAAVRRLLIEGGVQGVGFRWAMVGEAKRLGLRGWVRNRRDGSVEALVIGPAAAVDRLVAWAHRGPAAARVSRVDVQPADAAQAAEARAASGFEQRPTH